MTLRAKRSLEFGGSVIAPKLDVGFVKTFAEATLETLKVQCSFSAKAGKPFQKGGGMEIGVAIAGVIGITSSSFRGSIAIGFPEKTFLKIMSGMLGEPCEEMTQDIRDGAGELMNIIFGCAKKTLNDKGHNIEKAVPSVISGDKLNVLHMSNSPIVIIPFQSEGGNFQIEIVLE